MADKRLQLYRANAFFCGWGGVGDIMHQNRECILWDSPVLGKPLPPLGQWTTPTLVQYLNGRKKLKNLFTIFSITKR